jgi:uncharacterized coiled-coil DUF342 family protein
MQLLLIMLTRSLQLRNYTISKLKLKSTILLSEYSTFFNKELYASLIWSQIVMDSQQKEDSDDEILRAFKLFQGVTENNSSSTKTFFSGLNAATVIPWVVAVSMFLYYTGQSVSEKLNFVSKNSDDIMEVREEVKQNTSNNVKFVTTLNDFRDRYRSDILEVEKKTRELREELKTEFNDKISRQYNDVTELNYSMTGLLEKLKVFEIKIKSITEDLDGANREVVGLTQTSQANFSKIMAFKAKLDTLQSDITEMKEMVRKTKT